MLEILSKNSHGFADSRLLYSPAEVQKLLCMCRTRLWDEMKSGRLKYVTNGKRRFIRVDELHRYVESLESS